MCLERYGRGEACDEAHRSQFSIHPGGTMRYKDLRVYWCKRMKRESAKYKRSVGPLLPVLVAEWRWDHIDRFGSGLPRIGRG